MLQCGSKGFTGMRRGIKACMSRPANLSRTTQFSYLEQKRIRTRTHPSTMIFSRAVAFSVLALPLLATATPVELEKRQSCSTGPLQCCQQTQTVSPSIGIRTSIVLTAVAPSM